MKVNPLMIAPPLIFLALVTLFAFGMYRGDRDDVPSAFIGRMAPPLPPNAVPGFAQVSQDVFDGSGVTLVNFWGSWCPPCLAEHPRLLQLQAEGIPIVGVNFRDTESNAIRFLKDNGSPFASTVFDPKSRTAANWGVRAAPETFIIDGDGIVLFRFAGPLLGSDYEQRFVPELQKALAD